MTARNSPWPELVWYHETIELLLRPRKPLMPAWDKSDVDPEVSATPSEPAADDDDEVEVCAAAADDDEDEEEGATHSEVVVVVVVGAAAAAASF
jgi:hypothetical protein